MIEIDRLTYQYPDHTQPDREALHDLSLRVDEGAFLLVTGPSGSGKSTLLRALNGLVPHFYGGRVGGRVQVAGRDPLALGPRRMSETVGFCFQDPEAQAVVDVVEDELAFAMENQGLPREVMRERVEEMLDRLGIAHLRDRALSTLSGGERQRVAIAAALTLRPPLLVLDEPTSQLDPPAAREVLDAVARLNADLGLTVVLSEHRLERVVRYADRMLYLPGGDAPVLVGTPREVLAHMPLVPPLVEVGRRLGWSPLPLTVDEARSHLEKMPLALENARSSVAGEVAPGDVRAANAKRRAHSLMRPESDDVSPLALENARSSVAGEVISGDARIGGAEPPGAGEPAIEVRGLHFQYNGHPALQGIDLTVRRGEFVALVGHNGAGKTTLLKQCIGLLKPGAGQVQVLGHDTRHTAVERLARQVGYVPQNPNTLLFSETVAAELAFTRRALGLPATDGHELLRTLGLAPMAERYPRDLSAGERQRVALAAVLAGEPELLLLDEPTRGLDYVQKAALAEFLLAQRGRTVVMATHDVELVAQCAGRMVLLEGGQIVCDGPTAEVMRRFPAFGSQVGRLTEGRYLTAEALVEALS